MREFDHVHVLILVHVHIHNHDHDLELLVPPFQPHMTAGQNEGTEDCDEKRQRSLALPCSLHSQPIPALTMVCDAAHAMVHPPCPADSGVGMRFSGSDLTDGQCRGKEGRGSGDALAIQHDLGDARLHIAFAAGEAFCWRNELNRSHTPERSTLLALLCSALLYSNKQSNIPRGVSKGPRDGGREGEFLRVSSRKCNRVLY